jgi:hypothetical protein
MSELLKGVQIIAERIREFPNERPKWKHFMATQLTTMLTVEEISHISDAFNDMDREEFNARVLDCINDNEPKIRYKAEGRYATLWQDPMTAFGSPQIKAEGQNIGYGTLINDNNS